jgi:hypothetical protein
MNIKIVLSSVLFIAFSVVATNEATAHGRGHGRGVRYCVPRVVRYCPPPPPRYCAPPPVVVYNRPYRRVRPAYYNTCAPRVQYRHNGYYRR